MAVCVTVLGAAASIAAGEGVTGLATQEARAVSEEDLAAHTVAEDALLRTNVMGHTWHYWLRNPREEDLPASDKRYGTLPGHTRYDVTDRLLTLQRPFVDLAPDTSRREWFVRKGLGVVLVSTRVDETGTATFTWQSLDLSPGERYELREFLDSPAGQRLVRTVRTPAETTMLAYTFDDRTNGLDVTYERRDNRTGAVLEKQAHDGEVYKTMLAAEGLLRPELETIGLRWTDMTAEKAPARANGVSPSAGGVAAGGSALAADSAPRGSAATSTAMSGTLMPLAVGALAVAGVAAWAWWRQGRKGIATR